MIALQLYTVRDLAKADLLGTLRKLAEAGYTAVEFAGLQGVPAADVRATLDELGIQAVAAHVGLDRWEGEPDAVIDELAALGCAHAVVPWLARERRAIEGVDALADAMNGWGARCRDAGLRLSYHNHDFEFTTTGADGQTMMDRLLERTDPALVGIELDVYWAVYAGVEPLGFIQRLAGRMPLFHAKDMAAGPDKHDAPFGEGVLPWAELLPAARAAGAEWLIVEQDTPQDPLADVTTSLRNLQAATASL